MEGFASWLRFCHGYAPLWDFDIVYTLFLENVIVVAHVTFSILTLLLLPNSIGIMNLWNCFLRIAASTLASHPLVHTALSSLNTDQFLEAAVNGIACIPT